jgi:D-threo-aldose 1-dehydrogenase
MTKSGPNVNEGAVEAISAALPEAAVGRTDVRVSKLGFGTVALGLLGREDEALGLDAAMEAYKRGVTLFDTAPLYGNGLAEVRLGRVLPTLERSSFRVCTKVGRMVPVECESLPSDWRPPFSYTYDDAMRSFASSLARLKLDRVDIVLIHDIGAVTHGERHPAVFREAMDGAYRALAELQRAGTIGAIGVGVNEWQICEDVLAAVDVDVFLLAGRYTLLEQTAQESFLPLCERRGVSVFVGGPFNSGVLARGPAAPGVWYNYAPAPEPILERVRRIQAVCERFDISLPTAALRFPAAHPVVASVVFGPRSTSETALNLEGFQRPIDPALWRELQAEGLLRRDVPVPV